MPWLLLALLLIGSKAEAQLADNFTLPDITGVERSLFPVLAEGKVAILVFFSTDSEYAHAYHKSEDLKNLYASHGPNGDNQLEIFYIEGDSNTDDSCIGDTTNCSSSNHPPMDWTAGISFPIISSPALAEQYSVTEYPSIFIVCPNKRVRKVPNLNAGTLWESASECPIPSGDNNLGIYFFDSGVPFNEICGSTVLKPSFRLVNLGSNPQSNVVVRVKLNDLILQTITVNGTLAQLDERFIQSDQIVITDTGTLSVFVEPLPNESDVSDNIREQSFALAHNFLANAIRVRIRTDVYGFETYWEIKNESTQEIVASGGNDCVGINGGGVVLNPNCEDADKYSGYQQTTRLVTINATGCYSFTIVDAFGDGLLHCTSNNPCGYYLYETPTLYEDAPIKGHDYGRIDRRIFEITTVGTNEQPPIIEQGLSVFPNPANDLVQIQIEDEQNNTAQLSVYSATGVLVWQSEQQVLDSNLYQWQLNTSNYPNGIYVAVVHTEKGYYRRLFVKQSD